MDMNVTTESPVMGELKTANHLLGDQQALAAAWERDGYWYFRDVLDPKVIAQIRQAYIDYTVEMGVSDKGDPDYKYNGTDYSKMPINSNMTKLNERRADKILFEAPTINAFFTKLFGVEPFWLPFTVHRTNPPVAERKKSRFDFIHEDSVYTVGLPFIICWVPLDVIDDEVGGLALLEGVHNGPCLHTQANGQYLPIREEDVPAGTWRRTTYRPGDVLLMSRTTPHSGIANYSKDRFRLSMDTRIMPSNGNVPYVGFIEAVSTEGLTLRDSAGAHVLKFDENSFVRNFMGVKQPLENVPGLYPVGIEVIVAHEGDIVTVLRPVT